MPCGGSDLPSDVKDCALARRMALHDVTDWDFFDNWRPRRWTQHKAIVPDRSIIELAHDALSGAQGGRALARGPPAWTSASSARSVNSSEPLAKGLTPSVACSLNLLSSRPCRIYFGTMASCACSVPTMPKSQSCGEPSAAGAVCRSSVANPNPQLRRRKGWKGFGEKK